MSDNSPHIEPSTIRRLADGEISPQERAELEESGRLQEAERQAAFERNLREHVGRVMKRVPAAPAELLDRIRSAIRADAAGETGEPIGRIDGAGPAPATIQTRRRPFVKANIFAVAASLLLVASAVLFGIFGRPIDGWFETSVAGAADISEFVTSEHDRCVRNPQVLEDKIDFTDPDEAQAALSAKLDLQDKLITLFDLQSDGLDYEFVGGGTCGVVHCEDSAHLIYRRKDPDRGPAMASVFIGHNFDQSFVRTEPGNWHEMELTNRCTHKVFYSTDGSLVYMLVCCDSTDMEQLARAIGEQLRLSCTGRTK